MSQGTLREWMTWCPEDYTIERARIVAAAAGMGGG